MQSMMWLPLFANGLAVVVSLCNLSWFVVAYLCVGHYLFYMVVLGANTETLMFEMATECGLVFPHKHQYFTE